MPKILPEYQVQIDCLENLILQAPFLERELSDSINLLKRAKKVEELLGLYHKYSKGLVSGKLNVQQLVDLKDKIVQKEKELKALDYA